MTPTQLIVHGAEFPYDAGADFWEDRNPLPPPAADWAHAAARGVLADLLDRRGIKWALNDEQIDHETRAELTQTMAAIIRAAQWEPIDTAPKDESVVLLGYLPNPRLDRRVYEGRWSKGEGTWTSVNGFITHNSATHWRPLPDPPEA